ncbi:MAG: ion channel [Gemmatimonadota bacterium]
MADWFVTARRHPSAVLLAVQLIGVLAYPFMRDSASGRTLLSLFSMTVLLLAVWAVRSTPALTWIAILIGVPTAAFTILEGFYVDSASVVLTSSLLHSVFYFYTANGLMRYMFSDRDVTLDELYATGAAFTVVAWAFAYLFMAVQIVWPGSFIAALHSESPRTWFELLFLSFTTLTSTGLSDIQAVRPHARSVVMIEQVAGLMYVALVVARLVGLTLAHARGE